MGTSSLNEDHSYPPRQHSTEASETQLPGSPLQTNKFKSVRRRIKHRLKRAFNNFGVQHG